MWTLIYYIFLYNFINKHYGYKLPKYIVLLILISEILVIINNDLLLFILIQLLLFDSITDYINKDVYIYPNAIVIILGLSLHRSIYDLLSSTLIIPTVLFVLNKFYKGIGTGDIILLFCLGFIYNYKSMIYILLIASCTNLIYAFLVRKKQYSFVPFIALASMLIYAIKP